MSLEDQSVRDKSPGRRRILFGSLKTLALLVIFLIVVFATPGIYGAMGLTAWLESNAPGSFAYLYFVGGVLLILLATALLRRTGPVGAIAEVALSPLTLRGAAVALLSLLSMAAIVWTLSARPAPIEREYFLFGVLLQPFAEEVLFRGFIFRQMRRWARTPFWLAAALSSLAFAAGHAGQGSDLAGAAAAVAITFTGGIVMCWLVERWNSLWPAILLHAGLNGLWGIFALGETVLGSTTGNYGRIAAIAIAIVLTILLCRKAVRNPSGDLRPAQA